MSNFLILDLIFAPIGLCIFLYVLGIIEINLYKNASNDKKEDWDNHGVRGKILDKNEIEKYLSLQKQSKTDAIKYLALKIIKITVIILAIIITCFIVCHILTIITTKGI